MEKLPAELLLQIVQGISIDSGERKTIHTTGLLHQQTLYALCSTSKTMYNTAISALYADFDWIGKDTPKTSLLLRTLCESPALAQHIHSYAINLSDGKINLRSPAPAPSKEDVHLFETTITDFAPGDFRARLLDSLFGGCHIAEAIQIMMTARKVRKIEVTWDLSRNSCSCMGVCPDMEEALYCIFDPARLAVLAAGAYSNLNEIAIMHSPSPYARRNLHLYGVAYQTLNHILQLPSIERLTCNGLMRKTSTLAWTCPEKSNNLSELRFHLSHGDSTIFSKVIRTCRSLRMISIQPELFVGSQRWLNVTTPTRLLIDIPDLQTALNQHLESLVFLSLRDPLDGRGYLAKAASLIDLVQFSSLETLIIEQYLLYPTTLHRSSSDEREADLDLVLPQQLERLVIHHHGFDIYILSRILEIFGTYSNSRLQRLQIHFSVGTLEGVQGLTRTDLTSEVPWLIPLAERVWKLQVVADYNAYEFSVDAKDLLSNKIAETVLQHTVKAADAWPKKGGIAYTNSDGYKWVVWGGL